MTEAASTLPHWDMSVIYPSLDSPEFNADFAATVAAITELGALFDQHNVAQRSDPTVDAATVAAFEAVAARLNAVLDQTRTVGAYIASFVSTNSRDTQAQARRSELMRATVQLDQLGTRFTAWIGSLDVDSLITQSDLARDHAFPLQQAQRRAQHLMSPAEEALAAELNPTGGAAWARLHGNVTSQIMVALDRAGVIDHLPMSEVRNLAYDADRDVRRRAFEAEITTWEGVAVPLAAALNSIKGQVNTLSQRRGWASALDESLFANSIDRATLDTMMSAARDAFPDFRRYLHAKARALGIERLAWYDLFAPVGTSTTVWSYAAATDFIVHQFGSYSERLSEFAARAFHERWIDAAPRAGKSDGAFCMGVRRGESRILSNYKPAYGGVSTLAHELGHGYHNLNLIDRTALQRSLPMTLAETASIFCETIIRQAALDQADAQERITILESSLQSACQVVVDISSRFLFEQRVFEQRQERELSIDEFNELMLQAQRETYGDGLDQTALHPYMWAVKGHYYGPSLSFYNYPYMFGLLFGLGLYAQYQRDPDTFKAGYDDLLSSTGLADAATLAQRFGIDLRSRAFWDASFAIIRADVDQFEQLIAPGTAWTGV